MTKIELDTLASMPVHDSFGNVPEYELYHNGYIKRYPDGTARIICAQAQIFREAGWEVSDLSDSPPRRNGASVVEGGDGDGGSPADATGGEESLARSKRRARSAVFDIALCTPFSYFVTFTLDAACVDRYDVAAVTKKLNTWLDNAVRRKGLAYVLVPELHKDGAVHYHGLVNDVLPVTDSGTIVPPEGGKPRKPRSAKQREEWLSGGGHVVYNLPAWPLGFSTAIPLYGDRRAAVGYVCKYITKSADKVGGRWYYSGGELHRPQKRCCDVDFETIAQRSDAHVFNSGGMAILDIRTVENYPETDE